MRTGMKKVETTIPIESTIASQGLNKINTTNIPLHAEAHLVSQHETVSSGASLTQGTSHFTDNLNQKEGEILHAETKKVMTIDGKNITKGQMSGSSSSNYNQDLTKGKIEVNIKKDGEQIVSKDFDAKKMNESKTVTAGDTKVEVNVNKKDNKKF